MLLPDRGFVTGPRSDREQGTRSGQLTHDREVLTTMAKKAAPKAAEPRSTPAPAAKPATKAAAARPKPATKREIHAALAEKAGVGQEQVAGVFAALGELIGRELGKKGPGQFVVPGLLKLKVVRKLATKAKPGRNPFTGEAITIKAKPARNVVRVIPMKALKEMV